MKRTLTLFLIPASLLLLALYAVAQNTTPPPIPEGIPKATSEFWEFAITAVAPIIVWLAAKTVPRIPKPLLPTVTPVIGLALGGILNYVGATELGWLDMAKAGALAVFIRETFNQNVTKQLKGEEGSKVQSSKE